MFPDLDLDAAPSPSESDDEAPASRQISQLLLWCTKAFMQKAIFYHKLATHDNNQLFLSDLRCKLQLRYCLRRGCWRPHRCNVLCRPRRLPRSPACADHRPSRSGCQGSCGAHGLRRTTWTTGWITFSLTTSEDTKMHRSYTHTYTRLCLWAWLQPPWGSGKTRFSGKKIHPSSTSDTSHLGPRPWLCSLIWDPGGIRESTSFLLSHG